MLEVSGLEFAYDAGPPLRFDFDVADGELLSVIGPSGSGKSTLLHLLAGFLAPRAGSIRLDGDEIAGLPPAARPVTIVFQQHNLFPHLDLYTNVAIGLEPSLKLDEGQRARVAAALERLGLAGLERRKPGELSGGQRQRVALARALVRRRKLLLLDEAFAALGPAQRTEMIGLLSDLVSEYSLCALLVSHQPRDALAASARTAFVDGGRVLALRDTAELLRSTDIPALVDYLGEP